MRYEYFEEPVDDILSVLAGNLRKRRLEKGLSRKALTELSGVPSPTISRFETTGQISLSSFVLLAKSLGYVDQIKKLLSEPVYHTMSELDTINNNKNRRRGRRETGK